MSRFQRWIICCAVMAAAGGDAAGRDPAAARGHWALRPIERPPAPRIGARGWSRNPIDRFVLARLEEKGLEPSPEADRRTLIRRLSLDLTGLPPEPEEVDRFLADARPDAYERLVDRLLDSPRHGERWARHWLDAVRFAETNGFETNTPRERAWPYRDYVIRAFNDDRPFTRFIIEQLAGDATGEDAATGFLVGGPYDAVKSPDIGLTLEQRQNELHDMVHTTATAFLGLTVGCARCHDHKFDPITQSEYFSMQAVLAGVEHGEREASVPDYPERARRAEELRRGLAALEAEIDRLEPLADPQPQPGAAPRRRAVDPRRNVERFEPLRARRVRFTVLATSNLEPCIDELEVLTASDPPRNIALASLGARAAASSVYPNSEIHRLEHLNDGRYGNARSWISSETGAGWVEIELAEEAAIDRVVWGRDREGKYSDRLAVQYRIEAAGADGAWRTVASSADRAAAAGGKEPAGPAAGALGRKRELEERIRELVEKPRIYAGAFREPGPTHRLHRGDPMQKLEAVPPGGIAALGLPLEIPDAAPERERRLALARWIAHPRNPLTARVIANRIWLWHFGEGIVSTPSDFGRAGAPPSHPELLDWLAAELIERGWSLKALHRLIVLSSTYRQSNRPDARAAAADAGTRLLWRFPPRRLEAEAIRDSILCASGNLDLRMGGRGYDVFEPNDNYVRVYTPRETFGPAEWRRMVYQYNVRMEQDAAFGAFDCPDAGQICPKRPRSTTPLQALNLLNSQFVLQQAEYFSKRIERDAGREAAARARRAFRIALGREPDKVELPAAVELIGAHGAAALCRALYNSSEFLTLP